MEEQRSRTREIQRSASYHGPTYREQNVKATADLRATASTGVAGTTATVNGTAAEEQSWWKRVGLKTKVCLVFCFIAMFIGVFLLVAADGDMNHAVTWAGLVLLIISFVCFPVTCIMCWCSICCQDENEDDAAGLPANEAPGNVQMLRPLPHPIPGTTVPTYIHLPAPNPVPPVPSGSGRVSPNTLPAVGGWGGPAMQVSPMQPYAVPAGTPGMPASQVQPYFNQGAPIFNPAINTVQPGMPNAYGCVWNIVKLIKLNNIKFYEI